MKGKCKQAARVCVETARRTKTFSCARLGVSLPVEADTLETEAAVSYTSLSHGGPHGTGRLRLLGQEGRAQNGLLNLHAHLSARLISLVTVAATRSMSAGFRKNSLTPARHASVSMSSPESIMIGVLRRCVIL